MKKKLLLLAALAFGSFSSFGQVIMYEPFNYALTDPVYPTAPAANQLIGKTLTGVGTWQAASSTNANFNDWIEAQTMSITGMPAPVGNSFIWKGASNKPLIVWPTSQTSGKIYYSLIIRVVGWASTQAPDAYGKQMVSLAGDIPTGTNPSVKYLAALCVKGNQSTAGATSYHFGLSNSHISSTSVVGTNVVWTAGTFAFDVPHLVVLSYDIATGKSDLYIDPTVSATEPTSPSLTLTDGTVTSVGGFYIRQDSNAATPPTGIDEIRVTKTWAEAVGKVPLSVAKNDIEGLKVYPNPVTDGKLLISSASSDVKLVTFYNVLGSQVLEKEVTSGLLDVSSLPKGVYVLKITEAGKTSTRKVVID
ncbi:T9SS type A sorting domain-containing protein [Flavobacterium sp. NG2]|uniref:T9SS type A sorting domain-containing protein n=1 Tax=Flavobacterium sp. NG2 TaxID=3097547 RepID=UPI002A827171|nr:T9SS type A sorting domain-containing protein [Flavobacterium sp. NG2]WPR72128.1 T9SS type A sorting domain-containing protein [Flavobacterium sp. NG2]